VALLQLELQLELQLQLQLVAFTEELILELQDTCISISIGKLGMLSACVIYLWLFVIHHILFASALGGLSHLFLDLDIALVALNYNE